MAKRKTVRVGVIGCGQIGTRHIQNYRQMGNVEIVAVADISARARRAGAEAAGGALALADFRELLAMDEIEAVDVCLHNNLHAPVSIAAMEAGKHVYCEKPMAGSYADALAMHRTARRRRRKLAIQLYTLFLPETKVARHMIEAGALGRPYFARSVGFRRRGRSFVDGYGSRDFVDRDVSAGGALYDVGVYHIAQMLHLLGNPAPRTVTGSTYQELEMYPDRRRKSRYSVEELGLGYVRLAGGVTLVIEESWAIHLGSLGAGCIAGHKAGLTFEPLTLHTTTDDVEVDAAVQVKQTDTRWRQVYPGYAAYESAQHHWVATLDGTAAEPIDSGAVALNVMLISEGIYLSQQLGREVTAAEVAKRSKSSALKV
ncbi:MAG TPA: Gfo/Idh/MocA family oxidoreductase [Phycisphaerae bacterium]|nr:Gfo/Idh/MocA family oxidoreductase [Phycisphaerae bacterium]